MLKMLATLAIFFLCLGLLFLFLVWAFTSFVLGVEKVISLARELRIERMDIYINRKFDRLNGRMIYGRIKSIWKLEDIYLIPCPISVRFKILNRAYVSSYLIHKKLNLMNKL